MTIRPLDLPHSDGAIDATLHTPEGAGPWPGALLLTDIRGPRPDVFAMADRLAGAGYAVLVPNIYWRHGRAPVPDLSAPMGEPATMKALLALKATVTVAVMRHDARAMLDAMAGLEAVADAPVGVVGYCMSGQYAVHAAEVGGSRVAAAASYHGGELVRDDDASPHRVAAALGGTAFYFGHADKDDMIPQARLPELDRTLSEARADFTSEVYAGSPHGFAVPGSPRYDEPGAERHWRTLLALFGRTLVRA